MIEGCALGVPSHLCEYRETYGWGASLSPIAYRVRLFVFRALSVDRAKRPWPALPEI